MTKKFFKQIQLVGMLSLFLVVGCNNDDDSTILLPTVVSSDPAEKEINVQLNSSIEIIFNKEMDTSTINTTTFTLLEGTTPVSGTVAYLNKTATFSPISNLKAGTLYNATLTRGAKDLDGIAIASVYTFSFTTGVIVDANSPTVVSTDPMDKAVNVARNKVIAITFNEAMSSASFTATSFVLVQGTTPVTGAIEYTDKTARFIPDNILDASLSYTATVTADVKDLAGNTLATTKAWTFTTGTETGLSVVNLGASGTYVILAKTAINNSPTSAITGDMGLCCYFFYHRVWFNRRYRLRNFTTSNR